MPPRNDLVPTERIVYLDNPYIYKETISDSPLSLLGERRKPRRFQSVIDEKR